MSAPRRLSVTGPNQALVRAISAQPRGMKRAFLRVAQFLEGPWLALPASKRGFACQLHVYCAAQENGGRILGAKSWGSTQWRLVLGHGGSLSVVDGLVKATLVDWDGDDLLLNGYDVPAEDGYRRKREAGRLGGMRSAAAARLAGDAEGQADGGPPPSIGALDRYGASSRIAVNLSGGEPISGAEGMGSSGIVRPLKAVPVSPEKMSEIPANPDEALRLFCAIFEHRHGAPYTITAADSMALRNEWRELEPAEMGERMTTYLASRTQTTASIGGFVGWSTGPAGLRGERR